MMRRALLTGGVGLALFSLLTLASGCASTPADERPEITLSAVELTDVTLFETTMIAKVRISNPSIDEIVVEGATFKLVLDGKKVGRGMMQETVTGASLDSRVGAATFHINNASALLRLRDILEQGRVSYGIVGNLYLQSGSRTTKVKVEQEGRLDMDETTKGVETE